MAALVFEDEYCLIGPDRIDGETVEQRWRAVGEARLTARTAAVSLVVNVCRENRHGEEKIRIISARAAEKHEIRKNQEQKME